MPWRLLIYLPHPLLAGSRGPISVLPDHMHEGEVVLPPSVDLSVVFNGKSFVEYPRDQNGAQVLPDIIALGNVFPHVTVSYEQAHTQAMTTAQSRSFGIVGAYDGHLVNVGRVAVDSTWHHFFDINLIGDPVARKADGITPDGDKQQGFNATPQGRVHLEQIQEYYQNMQYWLIPSKKQRLLFAHAIADAIRVTTINEFARRRHHTDSQVLILGATVREALALTAPRWAPSTWLAAFIHGTHADALLPKPPHSLVEGATTPDVIDYDTLLNTILGETALTVARSPLANPSESPRAEELADVVAIGVSRGIRKLAMIRRQQADRFRDFADQLERALELESRANRVVGQSHLSRSKAGS